MHRLDIFRDRELKGAKKHKNFIAIMGTFGFVLNLLMGGYNIGRGQYIIAAANLIAGFFVVKPVVRYLKSYPNHVKAINAYYDAMKEFEEELSNDK